MNDALRRSWEGANQAVDREQRESMDAYDELLAMLDRPAADHWDRPHGDWGAIDTGDEAALTEARQAANSGYKLGTKALRRGDVSRAVDWFSLGADEHHAGAAFRWGAAESRRAFVVHCAAGSGKSMAFVHMVRLMVRASAWGHGDALRLVNRIRWREDEAADMPGGAVCSPRTRGWTGADNRAEWGESLSPRKRGWDPGQPVELRVSDLLPAHAGVDRLVEPVGDPCDGLPPEYTEVDPRPTPDSSPHDFAPRAHRATPLQSGSEGGTVDESVLDGDVLRRLTLAPDEEPYSPQDPEFYPEVREAFERFFAGFGNRRDLATEGGDEHTAVEDDAAPHQPAVVQVGDAPVAAPADTAGADGTGWEAAPVLPRVFPRRAALWTPVRFRHVGQPDALEFLEEHERVRTFAFDREGENPVDPVRRYMAAMRRTDPLRHEIIDPACGTGAFLMAAVASIAEAPHLVHRVPQLRSDPTVLCRVFPADAGPIAARAWHPGTCDAVNLTQIVQRLLFAAGVEAHPTMSTMAGRPNPGEVCGRSAHVGLCTPGCVLRELLAGEDTLLPGGPTPESFHGASGTQSGLHLSSIWTDWLDVLEQLVSEALGRTLPVPVRVFRGTSLQQVDETSVRTAALRAELSKPEVGAADVSQREDRVQVMVSALKVANAAHAQAVSA